MGEKFQFQLDKPYTVRLGDSFDKYKAKTYHNLTYNFLPESSQSSDPGLLRNEAGGLTVQLPNDVFYTGNWQATKSECALIEEQDGTLRIEKISTSALLKYQRNKTAALTIKPPVKRKEPEPSDEKPPVQKPLSRAKVASQPTKTTESFTSPPATITSPPPPLLPSKGKRANGTKAKKPAKASKRKAKSKKQEEDEMEEDDDDIFASALESELDQEQHPPITTPPPVPEAPQHAPDLKSLNNTTKNSTESLNTSDSDSSSDSSDSDSDSSSSSDSDSD